MFDSLFSKDNEKNRCSQDIDIPVVECQLSTQDFSNGFFNGRLPATSIKTYKHWPLSETRRER